MNLLKTKILESKFKAILLSHLKRGYTSKEALYKIIGVCETEIANIMARESNKEWEQELKESKS